MPVLSRFEGIVIRMYLQKKEHNPPHIHAICGDDNVVIQIPDGEVIEGELPARKLTLVLEFVKHYGAELLEMWNTQEFKNLPPV